MAKRSKKNQKQKVEDYSEYSLDQLIKELAKEEQKETPKHSTDISSIQTELESLPKIKSNLETQMETAAAAKKPLVVKVDDPITAPPAKIKKGEEPDSGDKWFNMKKPEMTPELKRDLLVLKNRSVLDPKRHYKKEKWETPKYLQSGTIIEGNTEFYSARMTKKMRGKTLAEEILNDSTATEYYKKKYLEITKVSKSGGKGHYKKLQSKRRGY